MVLGEEFRDCVTAGVPSPELLFDEEERLYTRGGMRSSEAHRVERTQVDRRVGAGNQRRE